MVLENDVDVGLHVEAPFEDSTDLGRGAYRNFCFRIVIFHMSLWVCVAFLAVAILDHPH